MKICGSLLVLLCCCLAETQLGGETVSGDDITCQGHHGEAETRQKEVMGAAQRTEAAATACTEQTCQPDIHTVLREMSTLVAEQRVELRHTKTQMEAMETRLTDRLKASEKTVVEHTVVIQELKKKQVEQAAAVAAVGGSVDLTGSQVKELWREREDRRVSFSASLVASGVETFGPISRPTTLIYRHVFTNTGNAYNPNTGVFTAPVRGVYHFVVFVHGFGHASTPTGLSLHKNEEHVVVAYSHQSNYRVDTSNGASLLLEVGDVVYVKLWADAWVVDSYNHHTTFSGHLLFPM
ncbi:hypothetical protein AALO_G00237200 [Alosa alosa]|uniref:C1q domain-containing protein n=1 Tax=Alosa alosa TaxID=278164 RepID=A0AAV6G0N4_9TELE|nr:complement C1q-like protein 2 [Alosa alosa]KAG5266872.1 hypothetical protein AALO_G00237200 [Alosa alosa]